MQLIMQSSSLYDTIMNGLNSLNERYPNIDFAYIIDTINNALPNAISSVQTVMTDIVPMIYNAWQIHYQLDHQYHSGFCDFMLPDVQQEVHYPWHETYYLCIL